MTLQDLLDELQALPASARTAFVHIETETANFDWRTVRYDSGEVIITLDEQEANDD